MSVDQDDTFEGKVGFEPMDRNKKCCPYCKGHGRLTHGLISGEPTETDCFLCNGTGEVSI